MYTQQDLDMISRQQKKRWMILGAVCALILAGIIYSFIIRVELLTSGLTLLLGALLIFFYDLTIRPLHCYSVFLRNALHGRTRELDCTYLGADEDISLVDGVKYYALSLEQQDEDGGDPFERMLYWDAMKPKPQLNKGDALHITYHDRMIVHLTRK